MRLVLALLCASLSCGCAEFQSIYHNRDLGVNRIHVMDAKQRAILSRARPATEKDPSREVTCAEPSPDAFSVLAASGSGNLTTESGLGASGAFGVSESGANLLTRTTVIQVLRDGYYRLCEGYMNGSIDPVAFVVGQRHYQNSLIALLAVEQLTGAVKSPSVNINAAAGGQAGAASALLASRRAVALEAEQLASASTDAEAQATAAEKARDEAKGKFDAATAAAKTDAEKKAAAELEAPYKAAKDNADKLRAKANNVKQAKKEADGTVASLDAALQSASGPAGTSAAAGVVVVGGETNDRPATAEVAKAVSAIVENMSNQDYGPLTCLEMVRLSLTGPTATFPATPPAPITSKDHVCAQVLGAYVKALSNATDIEIKRQDNIGKLLDKQGVLSAADAAKIAFALGSEPTRRRPGIVVPPIVPAQ